MMDTDFQSLWQKYDIQLRATRALDERLMRETALAKTSTALARLRNSSRFELVANAIAMLFLGSFAADHIHQWYVAVSALILEAGLVALCISTVVQLVEVSRIDYSGPVLAVAARIERVRAVRAATTFAILVLSPLLWTPLASVLSMVAFGVDSIAAFGAPWVLANAVCGLGVPAAVLAVIILWRSRGGSPSWVAIVSDHFSGRFIREARQQLAGIARFKDDTENA